MLVALDEVTDPQNLGAVCRTAECVGATGVVLPERRSAEVTPAVCKASAGAVEHLAIARVRNLADFLGEAKAAGCWCYGAAGEAPTAYTEPDYSGGAVLVLGAEGQGLRPRVAAACDVLVALPLRGRIGSLNVSAAAAVLLYEILQRGLTRPHNRAKLAHVELSLRVNDGASRSAPMQNMPRASADVLGPQAPGEVCATTNRSEPDPLPEGLLVARLATRAQSQVDAQFDDRYLLALAKQGSGDAYDRLVRRYYSFVRLKASSYFLIGGDSEDLIQEGLVGLYKAIRDYRSDRESSFRNFAELCITRQIITAVKTATRNKHTPLNGYVSFSATPAGATDASPRSTRSAGFDDARPGQPGHLLRGAALARRLPLDRAVRARVARPLALPGRALLHRHRRAPRVRLQDGRQRAAARQAQGGRPPADAGGSA